MKSSPEKGSSIGREQKKKKKKKKWTGRCLIHCQDIQATQHAATSSKKKETSLIALIAFLRKKLIAIGLLRDFPVLQYMVSSCIVFPIR